MDKKDCRYIYEKLNGSFRDSTEEEVKRAKETNEILLKLQKDQENIEKEIQQIKDNCLHIVRYDESGYPYDTRYCLACGSLLGIL